ncbi:MAG TPA: M24 family metallopeptidase [Phycisphaeraceae bacterium]|nr:M24 family metallopeptidase [Phycisphaeraceae bacterium]
MNRATELPLIMAGIPTVNFNVYRRLRFKAGDTVVFLDLGGGETHAIMRDIEMERARRNKAAKYIHCPADIVPREKLSGDRDSANAQAAAELLIKSGVSRVVADRTLPLLFAHHLQERGIDVTCDTELGIMERRCKDEWEIEQLRKAQRTTEQTMQRACEIVADSQAGAGGVLQYRGETLTSEWLRNFIETDLMKSNFAAPPSIVACGPQGADCHDLGSGELRTGMPVIIDIFPRDRETLYNGDCSRTVVHGEPAPTVKEMHRLVLQAKKEAEESARAGVTGEAVHEAACGVFRRAGHHIGLPGEGDPDSLICYTHGTGHGVGLDVHEPPLLDRAGPELIIGDALTIEPGLYCRAIGGVRVEDMVIVTEGKCLNLNTIPDGLTWS